MANIGYYILPSVEDVSELDGLTSPYYPAMVLVCKPGLGLAKAFVKQDAQSDWVFQPPVETTFTVSPAYHIVSMPFLSRLLAHLGAGGTLVRDFKTEGAVTEKLEVRWDSTNWHMERKGWQSDLWNEMDIMYDLLRYPEKWGIVGKLAPDDGSI